MIVALVWQDQAAVTVVAAVVAIGPIISKYFKSRGDA
jgi:hypothetical protein